MKYIDRILIFLLLLSVTFSFAQTLSFTDQQLKEDLTYLKNQLLDKHPNIFIYHTKAEFQDFFEDIKLPKTATAEEAYSIIAATSAVIKDGHTLFYPDSKLITRNNEQGRFIPLTVFWDGNDLFVKDNYSANKEIKRGMKLLSINGMNTQDLIKSMLDNMMRDGNNLNYPIWVLNNYFFEYYSYFYGCPKEFDLIVEDANGKPKDLNIKGMLKSDLLKALNSSNKQDSKGIAIDFDVDNNLAVLTIKDWHNNILRKYYKQSFKKEINKIFEQITNSKVENLIIDLRDNQGGDLINSKRLLSYLLESPFELIKEYKKVKNGKLSTAKGPQMGQHKPKSKTFKGKLFVLINGGSFSNSGIFCAALRKFDRAIFIGAETGGSEFVICSKSKMVKLPNTQIRIEIPTLQFLIKDYAKANLSGIKPDYEIQPTIQNLLEYKDVEKTFAIELIQKQ